MSNKNKKTISINKATSIKVYWEDDSYIPASIVNHFKSGLKEIS